jgi:hypothetical protein
MRIPRVVAGFTAIVTAVVGLCLATGGPAAASAGSWRAYGNTNPVTSSASNWSCGYTVPITSDVLAEACAIRSQNGLSQQAAMIVRNNRSSLYGVAATVKLEYYVGDPVYGTWDCPSSGVAANSWSVCFGATGNYAPDKLFAEGRVNAKDVVGSPWI